MRRFQPRTSGLTPDNAPTPPPFGAFAPNAAQAAIISLAWRSRLKRGAFRPMLSRLVNLLRAGPVDVQYQGASFRFYHQASATERGALFNPDYNLEEVDFLRAQTPVGGVFVDVGANLGTSHIVSAERSGNAIKVRSLRLQRILDDAGISHIDALKIDVEGYEDRVLISFFRQAPQALWPRAVVIEHLSRNEWLDDCIADMRARGYAETGTTRSNTLLVNAQG